MKTFLLFIGLFLFSDPQWLTSFDAAKKEATEKHELILLNFSGSDWCSPCIQLRKNIFESTEFKTYSEKCLVLLNADFPRLKKNKLSKEQTAENEKLADKYNSKGRFPFTVLMTADGKVLKEWDGLPNLSPAAFTKEVNDVVEANH
jgi:thioredoxin-related protein